MDGSSRSRHRTTPKAGGWNEEDLTPDLPDDEKAQAARILADEFAVGLDESTVEICKAAALEQWEADEE